MLPKINVKALMEGHNNELAKRARRADDDRLRRADLHWHATCASVIGAIANDDGAHYHRIDMDVAEYCCLPLELSQGEARDALRLPYFKRAA